MKVAKDIIGTEIVTQTRPCSFGSAGTKGDCFHISTSSVIEEKANCFSSSTYGRPCFYIKCQEEYDEIVETAPSELYATGFSKIRDVVRHGITDLIVLGWYTPVDEAERPVLAKLTYTANSTGDILNIHPIYGYVDLDTFVDVDIDSSSLEVFNTSSSTSNFAIKTDTEMVYINPVALTETARTSDTDALSYPFAYTDDTYWTNTNYWDGSYMPPTGIASTFLYETSSTKQLSYDAFPYEGDMEAVEARGIEVVSKDFVLASEGNMWSYMTAIDASWIAHAGTRSTVGGDVGLNVATGYNTISKKITDSIVEYTSGSNYFTSRLIPLPAISWEEIWHDSAPDWGEFSGQSKGTRASVGSMPTEVDLGATFLNIRPGLVFGDGYLGIGDNIAKPVRYAWETTSGKWYEYTTMPQHIDWYDMRTATGHTEHTQADVGSTRFIKVPFVSTDIRKVQMGDDWISMGIVAVSTSYKYTVNDMPELYGNPGAIVGDRCLVPIETPTADENGNIVIIDQSYTFSDNQTETRDIIFP